MKPIWGKLAIVTVGFTQAWAAESGLPVQTFTIDEFEDQAIRRGVQGRENDWALETAGYTRRVALRQTDSPSLSVNHSQRRSGSQAGPYETISTSKVTDLTLTETTPLGTTLNASGQYGDASGFSNGGILRPGWSAQVNQPLYVFVKNSVLRTRKRAELSFANAKDTYSSTTLSLRVQARSLYYGVLQAEESLQVQQRKLTSTQKLLDVTQALVKAGRSAPVETMRAKIRLQSEERALQNAQVARDKAVLAAKDFIFFPLDEPIQFTSKLRFKPVKASLEHLVQYGLLHRPQLNSLRRQKELAHIAYQAAVEPTRPTLSLNGAYNYSDNTLYVARGWSWTGTASWLFFDSFITRDNARSARIAEWVADLNIEDAERSNAINIQNAYLDLKNAERQIKDFDLQRNQAERDVEIVRLRFQNGLDRLIDVFDSADQLENLDNEYLNLLVSYNRTRDNLAQLLGGDVEAVR